ncbi:Ku protein [Mesorhizobium sp. KR9-304]|uniref:non-homologous end joining protein Ku n=1 Tax=Mesorhizobium sp. KR9-304 TaxID=3156614 RepID=UPI0032B3875E
MSLRAVWKGFLKFGGVSCGIKLINAASESEKIHFRILNRKDRLPVKAAYVDEVTGDIVGAEDQVKGYELNKGEYLLIEPEDIKKLKPTTEHMLEVEETVDLASIDQRYLDKPYYIVPADAMSKEPFAVIRKALATKKAAARARIVLYQRGREVVIRPYGDGMMMTTLRNATDVVSEKAIFDGIKVPKTDPEMVEIATLLIDKKIGKFDPSKFEDRYENALIEMINAKKAGKKPQKPAAPPKENVVNLADVLRKSLEKEGIKTDKARKPAAGGRRKSAA